MPLPDFETLSPVDETTGPDFDTLEAVPEIPGLPGGHIPIPPGYDPVTGHRQYGGPWSGALTGPYAQEGMQEAVQTLGAPLRAAGALTEGLMGTASEMAADFLRRTGIDPSAQPGEPMAAGPPPGSAKVITQALSPFHAPLPDWAQGAVEEGGRILRGFTEPGQAATLPFAAASKPIQWLYLAGAATQIPESIQRIYQAKGPEELGAAITGGAANIGMAELMRRGLTRQPGETYASRIREDAGQVQAPGFEQQGRQGQGGPDLEQPTPQQPGGGTPSFPQETQVLLDQGLANNRSLGIGHELEVLPDFGPTDPSHQYTFMATAPTVDAAGNVVRPGKILVSKAAFDIWDRQSLSKLSPEKRSEAIHRAVAEEGFHATITDKMAKDYFDTLSGPERSLREKLYRGPVKASEVPLSEIQLGHEFLRMELQKILRVGLTETGEVKGFEKMSRATLDALANVIKAFRELVGTKAAKAGRMITDELLNRYEQNLNAVAKASGEKQPFEDIYGGEQPFMIRRGAGEKKPQDIAGMDDASVTKYLADLKGKGIGPQYDSVVAGMKLSDKDLPDLTRLHEESGRKMMKALESGDQKAFEAEFGKNVWYAGAIEGARRSGPNYERLQAETRNAEIPGLPPVPRGTIRLYHGEGGPEGAGMFSQWFSEDPSRAASYGGHVTYVDIPESVAEHTKALAKKAGSGTSADHFLPEEWVMRSEPVPDEVRQKVYDLGPAALRRGKGKAGEQRELFLPPAAGEARPTATQLGATEAVRIGAAEISKGAYGVLQEMTDKALEQYTKRPTGKVHPPSFTEFGKAVKQQFGKMGTGAIFDLWQDLSWRRLLNASGKNLEALRNAYNLRKKLGDRQVADPPARGGFLTGETTTPTSEEAKGAAARQKYRNNVIAQIQEAMLTEATRHFRTERLTVAPEDIGFGRKAIRPAWNPITHQERANLQELGTILTDDAREEGMKVSNTKRLTVLVNNDSGKVEMVSTYRDPRRRAVLVDPESASKTHSPLAKILEKWTPVQSVLLDEPVKSFRQKYSSLIDFDDKFGKEARKLNEEQPEEAPSPEGELRTDVLRAGKPFEAQAPQVGPAPALRDPITPEEAQAFLESIFEERGSLEDPNDIKATLMSETLSRNKNAVLAVKKLALELDRKNPDLPLEDLLDKLANQIYENHTQAKSFEEFQSRTVAQGPAPSGKAPGTGAQAAAAAGQTGARELTVPTFARRAAPAPAGAGPEAALPAPQPPEMLSPKARAETEWQARQEHPELPGWYQKVLYTQLANREVPKFPYRIGAAKSIQEATAEAGGLEDVHSEDMPAMLRRTKQAAEDELKILYQNIIDLTKRQHTTHDITASLDSADTIANNTARRVETGVRLQSAKKPTGKMAQFFTAWRDGDRNVLTSAPHIVEAGAVRANGSVDLAKVKNEIPRFRSLAKVGLTKGEAMAKSGSIRERALGRAWVREAQNLLRELDYLDVHLTDPEMQKTASRISGELENQYQREKAAGYDLARDPAYLPHRWDAQLWNGKSILFRMLEPGKILGKKFTKPQKFDTVFDAIAQGPYLRATADGASLASHRVRQGMTMMLRDAWAKALRSIPTPDGKPLALQPVRLSVTSWGSPSKSYEVVAMRGREPLVIHEDFADMVSNLVGPNVIQKWAFTRNLLNLEQSLKHTLLIGDFFHLGRVVYYAAANMGTRFGWKGGWSVLDIDPKDVNEAVSRGVISQKTANWANEPVTIGNRTWTRRQIAEGGQRVGLNVGKIQDALYKDLVTHLTPSAGIVRRGFVALADPSVGRYNRFLFDKLTRGLMMETFVREVERQGKANPNADLNALARDIARDTNIFYGNIGRQGWFSAAWQQDLARMLMLAPQWVEGLIKKESIAYARAAGAAGRGAASAMGAQLPYRQGLPAMGTIGRGIGRGLGFMILLTQAINLISRHQPTWKNEEKGHGLDAWIPAWGGEEGGFWLSPMALFNEITHDVYRLVQDKPKWIDAISQIAGNKESPLVRAFAVAIGGHTPTGAYITSSAGQLGTAAEQLAPAPITFGRYARAAGHALAPGMIEPNLPGQVQRQVYSTFGLKVEPSKSALQEIQGLARDFAREQGHVETVHQEETDLPSYSRLRQAVRNEDKAGTFKILDKLRAQGKTDDQIIRAMKVWSNRPFTWSRESEDEFRWSLTPEQREKLSEATYQRLAEYNRFIEFLMLEPR